MWSIDPHILPASMAVTFPVLSHRLKQELPEGIHDSRFACFGRSRFPWLGENVNEAMFRNHSCGQQPTCCTYINISGKVETQLRKITEQANWLKKVTPSKGSSFDLSLIGLGLGDHGYKVHPTHQQ